MQSQDGMKMVHEAKKGGWVTEWPHGKEGHWVSEEMAGTMKHKRRPRGQERLL